MATESWWTRLCRRMGGLPPATSTEGNLATWLQHTQESERAVLARRLHDELGGLLTAARMDLSWLKSRIDSQGDEAMKQKAASIDAGLSEAMNLKRGVVDRLRPALLDHFGLATALQAHCEDACRRAGVPTDVQVAEEISAMPPDLALALFRASEYALTRVLRAPMPRHVELIAEVEGGRLLLSLRATGVAVDATPRDPLAMANFQHWVGRYGGTLVWEETGAGDAILRADTPVGASFSADAGSPDSRSTPAVR